MIFVTQSSDILRQGEIILKELWIGRFHRLHIHWLWVYIGSCAVLFLTSSFPQVGVGSFILTAVRKCQVWRSAHRATEGSKFKNLSINRVWPFSQTFVHVCMVHAHECIHRCNNSQQLVVPRLVPSCSVCGQWAKVELILGSLTISAVEVSYAASVTQ